MKLELRVVCRMALLALLPSAAPAATTPARTNAPGTESRYLIIVETSSVMKKRVENAQRVVGELIYSGMYGQIHPGDSIGLWTFNEQLYTGQFALMRWSPEKRTALASKAAEYIGQQKFEKKSQLASVMAMLPRVVTNSPKLTVLLVTAGDEPISGTPFDEKINSAYEPFRATQKDKRMPFTTVLRAKQGEYLGFTVNPAPWVVEFPAFPPDPPAPEPEPVAVTNAPPPRPVAAPLIVIGKKPENAPQSSELPQPGTELPKPGEPTSEAAPPAASPAATIPDPKTEAAPPHQPQASNIVPTPIPEKKIVEPATQPSSKPAESTPAANPAQTVQRTEPAPSVSTQSSSISSNAAVAPAVQAVVVPAERNSTRILMFVAGASLLIAALAVWYALASRRQRLHASLITRSMEQRGGDD